MEFAHGAAILSVRYIGSKPGDLLTNPGAMKVDLRLSIKQLAATFVVWSLALALAKGDPTHM